MCPYQPAIRARQLWGHAMRRRRGKSQSGPAGLGLVRFETCSRDPATMSKRQSFFFDFRSMWKRHIIVNSRFSTNQHHSLSIKFIVITIQNQLSICQNFVTTYNIFTSFEIRKIKISLHWSTHFFFRVFHFRNRFYFFLYVSSLLYCDFC